MNRKCGMKQLFNNSQVLIINTWKPLNPNGRHDAWPTHAVLTSSAVGGWLAASGSIYVTQSFELKNTVLYRYWLAGPMSNADFAIYNARAGQFFLPSGAGPFYGEWWNGVRAGVKGKFTDAEWSVFLAAH